MSSIASLSSYISHLEVLRTKNVEMDSHQWSARKMMLLDNDHKGARSFRSIVAGMGNQLNYSSGIKGFHRQRAWNRLGVRQPDEHYWAQNTDAEEDNSQDS